jgi:hypothetical protein
MAAQNDGGTNTPTRPEVVLPRGALDIVLSGLSGSGPPAPARRGSRWA